MTTAHSPLPWKTYNEDRHIRTLQGKIVAVTGHGDLVLDKDLADAALIVRAVNAHEPLLSHLKWATDIIAILAHEHLEQPSEKLTEARRQIAKMEAVIADAEKGIQEDA